jgi:hypothetical protein
MMAEHHKGYGVPPIRICPPPGRAMQSGCVESFNGRIAPSSVWKLLLAEDIRCGFLAVRRVGFRMSNLAPRHS